MRELKIIACLTAAILVAAATRMAVGQQRTPRPTGAQPSTAAQPLVIEEVAEGLHVITGSGGNVAVRVTTQGVILIDDMFARNHDEIVERVGRVTDQPIRYVVGTHHHGDHMGGNMPMSRHARIVAHENARTNMIAGNQPEPPHVVFTEQSSIFLGDAEVRLHHFGPGHTDGDAVVLFPDLGVLHTGDLVVGSTPFIDYARGGSSTAWIGTLDGILSLEFETVVPGHGPVMTKRDIQTFRDRFVTLRMRMTQLIRGRVPRDAALARLETGDLEWPLAPNGPFVQRSWPAFYDEIQSEM